MSDKTIPIHQHREIVRNLKDRRRVPLQIPDWMFRGILAATLAIASASLGWSFSISQQVSSMQATQAANLSRLQEINQRLEDIQIRLMQNARGTNGVYYPPSDWHPYLGLPAATHPIKLEGGLDI